MKTEKANSLFVSKGEEVKIILLNSIFDGVIINNNIVDEYLAFLKKNNIEEFKVLSPEWDSYNGAYFTTFSFETFVRERCPIMMPPFVEEESGWVRYAFEEVECDNKYIKKYKPIMGPVRDGNGHEYFRFRSYNDAINAIILKVYNANLQYPKFEAILNGEHLSPERFKR